MSAPSLDSATVAALLDSMGGDEEFLAELFSAFAEEAPGLMASIESSAVSGDFETLRRAAHTLKSTSASLGALSLSDVSRELEEKGKTTTTPDPARVAETRSLLEEALAAMTEMTARN
jgi:HPt (histidine-containing phosphotransfer) domain-containing protein